MLWLEHFSDEGINTDAGYKFSWYVSYEVGCDDCKYIDECNHINKLIDSIFNSPCEEFEHREPFTKIDVWCTVNGVERNI